jgi:hypothetical protein
MATFASMNYLRTSRGIFYTAVLKQELKDRKQTPLGQLAGPLLTKDFEDDEHDGKSH